MHMRELMELSGQINAIANAYKRSQILFTALDGGVFSLLEGAGAPADAVAAACGWSARGAAMLLDGLVALELVEKRDGLYRNGAAASACLVPGGPCWQGEIIRHTRASWDAWAALPEAVRTGACAVRPEQERSGGDLRNFILGMDNIARFSAREMLAAVDLSRYRRMLDLAGGPATYAITFLGAHPALHATLFDRPAVIEIAREQVARAGLENRFTYLGGDCLVNDLGGPYDLVLMSNIIHSFGPEENALLVRKAHAALERGGTLIIKDFLVENDRSGPAYGLIFALHMLVHTPAGGTYSFDEVQSWTDAAGFGPGRVVSLTPQTRLWMVEKV